MSFTHLITSIPLHMRLQLYKRHHFHPQTSDTHTCFPSYPKSDRLIFKHLFKSISFLHGIELFSQALYSCSCSFLPKVWKSLHHRNCVLIVTYAMH